MSTAKFEVGTEEKHIVEASFSPISGVFKVRLDGKQISSKMLLGSGKTSFDVGLKEKHTVEIKASGIAASRLELFVDGVSQAVSREPLKTSRIVIYIILVIIAVLLGYFGMQWLLSGLFG